MYAEQSGVVQCDCVSRPFKISRGTKQGDPISPALFNAALDSLMRTLEFQGCGDGRLVNLRFADDLVLISKSKDEVHIMMKDLVRESRLPGLSLHTGKTKVMHNEVGEDFLGT